MLYLRSAVVGALVVAGVHVAAAQDDHSPAEQSLVEQPMATLGHIVVTAAAPDSALTFTIDPRLPRQPVPASDGADYLKTIAGFTAVRNGGTNGDPVLRGMFGSRLNLLTNDGSMPGACPGRMDNTLSYVSPQTYDLLSVVKGPQTVLWGPGASAGTVRFERTPEPFEHAGLRAHANVLSGSYDRNDQMLDLTAGARYGYARLTANHSQADDYEDGNGNVVPSRWKKWNADVAFGWTPGEDTLLEFSIGGGDGEARYAGRSMDGSQFERNSYAVRFERRNPGGLLTEVTASAFLNDADHVMDNYSLRDPNPMSSMPMPRASNVDRRTYGGRVATTWGLANLDWTVGLDAQASRHRRRSATGRGMYASLPWTTDAEFSNVGAFGELTWRFAGKNRVIAGARGDRAEVTDERQIGAGMMAMPNPTAGVTRREILRGGFLRFEQDLNDMPVVWFAGIGHAERMPDYWELFSADRGPAGAMNAFTGIGPEKTTQLDLGIQYRGEHLDAWASAYAGRIDDYILFSYMRGGMMGTTSRVDSIDARTRGGEAGVEYRLRHHWTLGGTLAYAWGENRDANGALAQMPPLETRVSLAYDNAQWSFGALLRAVDRQSRVAIDQGNVVGRDLGPAAGFVVVSLNGGYHLSSHVQITAGIDNLLDRNYREHLNLAGSADFGYPADPVRIAEPGRSAWVRMNLTFK
ncbi:TonB-dependent receptor [Steroidobacter denitrificans]|uniref:TonB-dependent receptor n=1 Tax=Steroidobacter denitrificans TaxID=465721 RepID=A0A127F653_STEDE|nr:TonB-dependent copper receptor [Steroidobacter denitrificans]AMN45926.1 TonB-dependent receptor [Steroidobacter denitrificans]